MDRKKQFDIVHFDAHHDMYRWGSKEYFQDKHGLSNYHPFETMIAPLKMEWVDNIIWVHPDYVNPNVPDFKDLYPNSNITCVQWSDWNWNNHNMVYLSVVTNPDMSIINQGMIEDFSKIIQSW